MFISNLQNFGHGKSIREGPNDESSQFINWDNSGAFTNDLNRPVECLVVLRV